MVGKQQKSSHAGTPGGAWEHQGVSTHYHTNLVIPSPCEIRSINLGAKTDGKEKTGQIDIHRSQLSHAQDGLPHRWWLADLTHFLSQQSPKDCYHNKGKKLKSLSQQRREA